MSTWMLLSILFGISAIGLITIIMDKIHLHNRLAFCEEYAHKFSEFCSAVGKGNFDSDGYIWLTSNVGKIQDELGSDGIVYHYRPPFANYVYTRYQLLVNTLPQIRTGQADRDTIAACQDSLIRHFGYLNRIDETYINRVRNPLMWLREGITFIITFPIRLAYWFGLFQYSFLIKIGNSFFIRLISFIVSVIGLVSSIVTILLGWENFLKLLKSLPFFELLLK